MSDTETTPGTSEEEEADQAIAPQAVETEKKGPFSDQQGGVTESPTVEQGSDPQNINREEDAKNRAEVEAAIEAASRIALAQKHPDTDTGQGVPLPVADPMPALHPSSPVSREELTTQTQREGVELEETPEGETPPDEGTTTSQDEEYPATVEPSP
jgi:hypothetical protein